MSSDKPAIPNRDRCGIRRRGIFPLTAAHGRPEMRAAGKLAAGLGRIFQFLGMVSNEGRRMIAELASKPAPVPEKIQT